MKPTLACLAHLALCAASCTVDQRLWHEQSTDPSGPLAQNDLDTGGDAADSQDQATATSLGWTPITRMSDVGPTAGRVFEGTGTFDVEYDDVWDCYDLGAFDAQTEFVIRLEQPEDWALPGYSALSFDTLEGEELNGFGGFDPERNQGISSGTTFETACTHCTLCVTPGDDSGARESRPYWTGDYTVRITVYP